MVQQRRNGNHRRFRTGQPKRPKFYKILCSGCGKEVVTPVPPPSEKKLLCMECFGK